MVPAGDHLEPSVQDDGRHGTGGGTYNDKGALRAPLSLKTGRAPTLGRQNATRRCIAGFDQTADAIPPPSLGG